MDYIYFKNIPKITYGIHRCFLDNIIDQAMINNVNLHEYLFMAINNIHNYNMYKSNNKESYLFKNLIFEVKYACENKKSFLNNSSQREYIKPVILSEYECKFINDVLEYDDDVKGNLNWGIKLNDILQLANNERIKIELIYYLKNLLSNYLNFILEYILNPNLNNSIEIYNYLNDDDWILKCYDKITSKGIFDMFYKIPSEGQYLKNKNKLYSSELYEIKKIISVKKSSYPNCNIKLSDLCYIDKLNNVNSILSFSKNLSIPFDVISIIVKYLNNIYYNDNMIDNYNITLNNEIKPIKINQINISINKLNIGDAVYIINVKSEKFKYLNDTVGQINGYNEKKDRYIVYCLDDDKERLFNITNIKKALN